MRLPVSLLLCGLTAFGLMLPPDSVQAGAMFGAARSAIARRAAHPPAAMPAGKPQDVVISRSRHPEAAAHIDHAQRNGQPTVLQIDRSNAARRRAAAIGGVDRHRKPAPHYERDEYPPAYTREGGHNANVRFISPRDNRGAGASMGSQTRHLPDGSRIRVVIAD